MKRPTSLKVSGIKYRIRYDHTDTESYGETNPDNNTISIRDNLPEDKQIRVLVHELTHAVIFETPFSIRKRFDLEEVCDIVGWHFLDLLRANPELAQFILREIEDTDE